MMRDFMKHPRQTFGLFSSDLLTWFIVEFAVLKFYSTRVHLFETRAIKSTKDDFTDDWINCLFGRSFNNRNWQSFASSTLTSTTIFLLNYPSLLYSIHLKAYVVDKTVKIKFSFLFLHIFWHFRSVLDSTSSILHHKMQQMFSGIRSLTF
jgi:hypothetical protein